MKAAFCCILAIVVGAFARATIVPNKSGASFTRKEIAQGYRDGVILAQPLPVRLSTVDSDEAREGVRVRRAFPRFGGLRVIELNSGDTVSTAVARLKATGRYAFVEPDRLRFAQVAPNDPKYLDGSLWAFNNTGQPGVSVIGVAGADIKAPQAWGIIHDAPNVIVAVLDTGINPNHQDIASNLWTNSAPTVGDLHGANFVGGQGSIMSGNPADDNGHGTHVAGTIGAVGNNGLDVTGVAWKVQIMALKVLNSTGVGSDSDIVAAMNYAIGHGASILNASFGDDGASGYSQTEMAAASAARNSGVILVAAAGNSAADLDVVPAYPANYPLDNIVTVGASNRRDEIATSYSNFGAAVDLFAPGDEIVSLDFASNTGTVMYSGTSMAAPHVSGALALLKAEFPGETYRQLINRLLRGVDRGANFIGQAQSGGRLNLYRALTTTTNRPFNDDFADRPHFDSENLSIRSNNVGATAEESSEPAHAGVAATTSLWWEWTAPESGTVSVDTSGSDHDTVLAIYTGSSLGSLVPVVSNDDYNGNFTSRVTFAAQSGTTYEIAVDGKNGATGTTLLHLGTTPANDSFATPVVLTGASTHVTATNANCSREPGEPTILGFPGGTSLWYEWTAPGTGHFQVAAFSNDFDPILAVYTGDRVNALTLVTASDNTGTDNAETAALCSIDATAGATYRITVDSKSASTIGKFTLSLVDSLWQATTGASVTGTPAVGGDGTVYVGSTDGSLYAYAPDGTQKWVLATGGYIDTCAPAIADDGTVYVGSSDGKLYAVTPNGGTKWVHDFNAGTGTSFTAWFSPAIAVDGTIYMRASDGYVHALNPSDGSERWKANVNATLPAFYGNPAVAGDGTIYEGSDESDDGMYAINPDGTRKWRFATDSGIYGAPAIDAAGNIYFASLTGSVYSLDASSGLRWQATSAGDISSSIALSPDGKTLYYAGYDAKLYARDTDKGGVRWTFPLGDQVRSSSPAVDGNGVIYIGAYDGVVYAVNPDGSLKRTYDAGDLIRSSPTLFGTRLYFGSNDKKLYAFDLAAGPGSGPWPQYRNNVRRLGRALGGTFAITSQPQSLTAVEGLSFTLGVAVTAPDPVTYQWYKDGKALPGATGPGYAVGNVSAVDAGTYTVSVTSGQTVLTSDSATVTVEPINPGRLVNLSVLTRAGTGAEMLILGFTVSGSSPKPLVVRGVGPTLSSFGVADPLADPQLQLVYFPSNQLVAENDDWSDPALPAAESQVGAFQLPSGSRDAAVIATVPANNSYSVEIMGAGGETGPAIAEVYDMDPTAVGISPSRLVNLSARAEVDSGQLLTAGFSISGNVPKRILVRGIGPGLIPYGVSGVLGNPKLAIYEHSTVVGGNDDWGGTADLTAAFKQVGAFSLSAGSLDAAVLLTLPPGVYSAQLSGVGGASGVALIEVYEVP